MEHTHTQIAYLDPQLNFVWVNAAYERSSGYSALDLVGRNHFELFPHPENQAIFERVRDTGQAVALHAKPFTFLDRPELGTTYWDWTLTPVMGASGNVEGLVLSLLNVTARERARLEREAQGARQSLLVEVSKGILAEKTVQGVLQRAVDAACELADARLAVSVFISPDGHLQIGPTHCAEGAPPCLPEQTFAMERGSVYLDLIQGRSSMRLTDKEMRRHSAWWGLPKSHVPLQGFLGARLVSQDEQTLGVIMLSDKLEGDFTAEDEALLARLASLASMVLQHLKAHEEAQRYADELEQTVAERTAALRASQARLQAIYDGAPLGIALVDSDGRLIESNPAFREIVGYSVEELRGKPFDEFTHPDDLQAGPEPIEQFVADRRDRYHLKKRYIRKDGCTVWVALSATAIRADKGRPRLALQIVEDITEKRQAQQALIQAEKLSVTGQLAASLAHEINNPLQAVIGYLDLAEEALAEGGEPGRRYLEVAQQELGRAARVVSQLRDLHRRSSTGERELADVNALVEQVLAVSAGQCKHRSVKLDWRGADNLPPLPVCSDQLRQVFLNLVLNAVDAMPDGGQLRVSTAHTPIPDGIRVQFADTGIGISADNLPHLFEPFYTTRPDGLGLGLYVSQNIVEHHGGRIEVESTVGQGTTFTVWLPR